MKKFMQGFWAVFDKDIQSEGFTLHEWLTFGIIVPGLFIALLVLWDMIQAWAEQ
jgi:hypothetical protein